MSSVGRSTIEDLQKKDSTLKKKSFDRVGKPIIRDNNVLRFLHEKWTTLSETSRDENGKMFKPVSGS